MPKQPNKFEPWFDEKRQRWCIDIPATHSLNQKRFRKWFKSRDAGRRFIEELVNPSSPTASISPILAIEADKARIILAPHNRDLVQGARELAEALTVLGSSGSLIDAAKKYAYDHAAAIASVPFSEAVKSYLLARDGLAARTLKSYTHTLQYMMRPFNDVPLSSIRSDDLENVVSGKNFTSRNLYVRNLKAFWNWSSKAPRKWTTTAAVDDLEMIQRPGGRDAEKDIEILTPDDVRELLHASAKISAQAAAAFAIAIFGGVRSTELCRLLWQDVKEDHIEIGRKIAKKNSRRLVPVSAVMKAWIDAGRGENDENVIPTKWEDVGKACRRLAGWKVQARALTLPAPEPTRGPWPANACRHTCASVQVAIGTPLDKLTFAFGHVGGHDLLRRHYVSRMTKKEAEEILSIYPSGYKVPKTNVSKKAAAKKENA